MTNKGPQWGGPDVNPIYIQVNHTSVAITGLNEFTKIGKDVQYLSLSRVVDSQIIFIDRFSPVEGYLDRYFGDLRIHLLDDSHSKTKKLLEGKCVVQKLF